MSRILLLLNNKENSRLMVKFLECRYEVIVPDAMEAEKIYELLQQPFDLCILCGLMLERFSQQVQQIREAQSPLLLPFLVVTARPAVKMMTDRLWQIVDELIITPIEKHELHRRVEILLRSRQLTQQLLTANKKLLMETEQLECLESLRLSLEKEQSLSQLKNQFFSMMSHEFRSPLQVILSSTEIIERHSAEISLQKKQHFLQLIKRNIKKISKLLDDVLVVGRVDFGSLKTNLQLVNLAEFCNDLLDDVRLSTSNKLQINLSISGEFCDVYIDENLLRHILTNLLENAVKYTTSGKSVNLAVSCQNGSATFCIQDNGIGIPQEDKHKLFDLFHRASNVKNIPGTGLGLAIVKRCVDLYGGQIDVESQEGVGSKFILTLPLPQLVAVCR